MSKTRNIFVRHIDVIKAKSRGKWGRNRPPADHTEVLCYFLRRAWERSAIDVEGKGEGEGGAGGGEEEDENERGLGLFSVLSKLRVVCC